MNKQKGFAAPLIILGIVILIVIAAGVLYVRKVTTRNPVITTIKKETPKFEPGKVIVKFKPGISVNSNVSPSQATNSKNINQLLEKIQANKITSLYYEENTSMLATPSARDSILERYFVIFVNQDSDVEQIVSEFQADPGVENVSLNWYLRITQ